MKLVSKRAFARVATVAAIGTAFFAAAKPAEAWVIFNIDTIITTPPDVDPLNVPIGTLKIENTVPGAVLMTLTMASNNPSTIYFADLYMNLSSFGGTYAVTGASSHVVDWEFDENDLTVAGKLDLDFMIDFENSTSGNRLGPGDVATWTVTSTLPTFNEGSFVSTAVEAPSWDGPSPVFLVGHIQGLPINGSGDGGSARYGATTPVPEPASLAVLGLGVLPFLRRRFKK